MSDKRDAFNFQIVRMSAITSNIPSIRFCSSIILEFVRSTSLSLSPKDSLPAAKNLLHRIINQGVSKNMLLKRIKKAFNSKPEFCFNLDKYKKCF